MQAAAAPAFVPAVRAAAVLNPPNSADIRIRDIRCTYEEFLYRAPYQFGGRTVDRATILTVECRVESRNGRSATGFGAMPLGNIWSFPSKTMSYDRTLGAMKELAARIAEVSSSLPDLGHPVELNALLEPLWLKEADSLTSRLVLSSPVPKLCTLVTGSPFDAAVHDAYGKMLGLNCYSTYSSRFMNRSLDHYLGREFKGEFLDFYIRSNPLPRIPMFHSVGAGDPISASDIRRRLNDGLPETLAEWIAYNGLTHIKIKLNGEDLEGDLDRVFRIDRETETAERKRGAARWFYCLDFNENCPNVEFLLEFLNRLKEKAPLAFQNILYIEQPTARDLKSNRSSRMHKAARLRPVVIDESLTDLESLLLAREMGYTGIALKACKGQSQALLMAAAGQKYKMFLCVQDLTCPGAALLHSAGLAAHVPGVSGIEANARQYVPVANKPWENRFPGMFVVKDGTLETGLLTRPGLSAFVN